MTPSSSHKIYRAQIHSDLVGYAREGKAALKKLTIKNELRSRLLRVIYQ